MNILRQSTSRSPSVKVPLRAIALLSIAGLLGSCAGSAAKTGESQASQAGEQDGGIFYASQAEADSDLARFERENPSCQLWTNWQKVCDRVKGQMRCRSDAVRPVEPSKVFCASPNGMAVVSNETASYFRFCDERGEVGLSQLIDGEIVRSVTTVCERFASKRPFNGRDFQTLRIDQCAEWSDRLTGDLICSEGEVETCDVVKTVSHGAFCSRKLNTECSYDEDAVEAHARRYTVDEAGIIADSNRDIARFLEGRAIHSMKCE